MRGAVAPAGARAGVEGPIPVIDISGFAAGSTATRHEIAAAVADACERIGFLWIAGHGVDPALLERAFDVSIAFFERPVADKLRYAPQGEVAPRGYAALASKGLAATLGETAPKDLREQFMLGPLAPMPAGLDACPHARGCYAANVWPEEPAEYRDVFTRLYRDMEVLAARLMGLFALGLDLPQDYFERYLDRHFSVLGSNYYPVPEGPPMPGQLRTGAHTDFGSLTILCPTAGPGGLQVRTASGGWQDVQPIPGTLIVNIGDMLARWTNDRWKSTLHRVVNPPQTTGAASRRQSIAYFCHPNYDAEIDCLASCTDAANPPRYPRILAGEHMRQKMVKR